MSFQSASDALARFTVIDLTRARAGPSCVRQLADWGADVIKVEMPPAPDRPFPDFADRYDSDFQNLHRNKRSITLDLKTDEGLTVLKRLAERADVLVENYRPDVKERLGFGYEAMRAVNPRLVYTSISGFGQDGPYASRPGLDQIAQGMSGLMSITGAPGGGPMRVGIAIADVAAGVFGALGTLTALLERETSGEGQWVQTSLLQAALFMLDFQAARWLMKGDVPGQVGNDHPTAVPMGCFRTSDGSINVAPMPNAWPRFCAVLGIEEAAADPDFATPAGRLAHRGRVNAAVQAALLARDSASWIDLLNASGIPCGPVYGVDEAFADPQVRHLGMAQTVASPELGAITLLGQPYTLSRTDSSLAVAPPECGASTDEVLAWAGYSAEEIDGLRRRNVL
ncbi:MAG: CoA transferase [Alphaproteobacteria bacterium]|nr:CoA transferase [Alphaproteobacteria bacterium]